jgi:hypothetical protein
VHDTLARLGQDVSSFLGHARFTVPAPSKAQALLAADAKRMVPELSLGDAFAFALAAHRRARLFTTDPAFGHPWVLERASLTLIPR